MHLYHTIYDIYLKWERKKNSLKDSKLIDKWWTAEEEGGRDPEHPTSVPDNLSCVQISQH